jgi:uncharacterized protein
MVIEQGDVFWVDLGEPVGSAPDFQPVKSPAIQLPSVEEIEFLSPKIRQLLKVFKRELEAIYHERLVHLVLYGSFARHEETEGSDVDILVVLKGAIFPVDEIRRMGDTSTDLLLKYNELISIVPMSLDNFLYRSSPLLRNVRREGILL